MAVLFLSQMVQPRPDTIILDDDDPANLKQLGKKSSANGGPMYLDAASVAFFVYAGWSISDHIPTNR